MHAYNKQNKKREVHKKWNGPFLWQRQREHRTKEGHFESVHRHPIVQQNSTSIATVRIEAPECPAHTLLPFQQSALAILH